MKRGLLTSRMTYWSLLAGLLTILPRSVRAQATAETANAPSDADSVPRYGRADQLAAPPMLEELSERLWDLEDQTRKADGLIPRRAAALHALYGVGHSRDIAWHQLIGVGLSIRVSWWGRVAKQPRVLAHRYDLLEKEHAERLKLVLGQECLRAREAVKEYDARLTQTQRDLELVGVVRKLAPEPKYEPESKPQVIAKPFAPACTKPPVAQSSIAPDPKSTAATPSAQTGAPEAATSATTPQQTVAVDEGAKDRRKVFLQDVELDLRQRLAAAQADLKFLLATDLAASETMSKALSVVSETRRGIYAPHFEAFLGYTFQLSQHGVGGGDLGGLTAGAGVGIAPISVGLFVANPRVWGIYLSMSAEIID
jgi:hypothetical protein